MKSIAIAIVSLAAYAQGPLMQSILPRYETAKKNLIESAELMPAGDYGYKLSPPQRSFGEWIEHNVSMNYGQCSALRGEAPPKDKMPKGMTAKADLEAALKESFEYCDKAFMPMDDQKALMERDAPGGKKMVPANTMIGLLNSWNQHYGNLVGYMRTKGLTPPSTARAQKAPHR